MRSRRAACAALWGVLLAGRAPAQAPATTAAPAPPAGPAFAPVAVVDSLGQVRTSVQPETVTVGQPFTLLLRAVPPRGHTAQPPAVPDTGGIVEPLDPAYTTRRGDTLVVRYRLIAWQPGVLTIPLGPVLMRREASELSVPFDARVVVRSVLPADTADRVAKPARDLLADVTPWWAQWWQWALGLLAALLLVFLAERWRTRRRQVDDPSLSPLERAELAFARLDARGLPALGEGGRHAALAAEIFRQYLADVEPTLALSLTGSELLEAMKPVAGIPDRQVAHLLRQVDAVRFGGGTVTRDVVQSVSGDARALVREIARLRASGSERAA
ncbi:MAG: hypothetical protein IT355_06975 [Gemmatimonadaceae bacterium]|nr:hypothetical protein [Gemmatimonadaceae bacterium]